MKVGFWVVVTMLAVAAGLCFLVSRLAGSACLAASIVVAGGGILLSRRAARDTADDPESRQDERESAQGVYMMLRRLSKDYRVFDRVPTVEGTIDHVVVSRQGVAFAISLKTHPGRIRFEGDTLLIDGQPPEKDFLGQCLRNAYWVKEKIREQTGREIVAHPILVFARAFVDTHEPVRGVQVISARNLMRRIEEELPRRDMSSVLEKVRL